MNNTPSEMWARPAQYSSEALGQLWPSAREACFTQVCHLHCDGWTYKNTHAETLKAKIKSGLYAGKYGTLRDPPKSGHTWTNGKLIPCTEPVLIPKWPFEFVADAIDQMVFWNRLHDCGDLMWVICTHQALMKEIQEMRVVKGRKLDQSYEFQMSDGNDEYQLLFYPESQTYTLAKRRYFFNWDSTDDN